MVAAGVSVTGVSSTGTGLCDRCVHQRIVRNTRGSVFSMCERSRTDSSFAKYPRLPVIECRGFEATRPAR
jgi:hypothetical protein